MPTGKRAIYNAILLLVGGLLAYHVLAVIAIFDPAWQSRVDFLRQSLAFLLIVMSSVYVFIVDRTPHTSDLRFMRWACSGGLVLYLIGSAAGLAGVLPLTLTPAAASLGFWLMYRYSTITQLWGDLAVKVVTGWLVLAGVLLAFDTRTWPDFLGYIAVAVIALAYIIFAAHIHKALINPNGTRTLAAYWHAAAVILWLCGGLLGAVLTVADVAMMTSQSPLATLPIFISELAIMALGLGLVNQILAELRGENQRVTGLLPYWCMLGGWLLALLMRLLRGTVLLYDPAIAPDSLRQFEAFALTIALGGAIIFALGVYARRIRWNEI